MKILMVSTVPPHPSDEGNRARILSLCREIRSLGHDLHFAFLDLWRSKSYDRERCAGEFAEGRFTVLTGRSPAHSSLPSRLLRRAGRELGLDAAYRYGLDSWFDPNHVQLLRELDTRHGFDAVIVEYVFASRAFEAFGKRVLKILDTHDIFADRHKALKGVGPKASWFSTSPAAELAGLRRADIVIAIQDGEAEIFRRRLAGTSTSVRTVGHLLDLSGRIPPGTREACAFLGSDNISNVEAIRYFIAEVLPRIRGREPEFRLILGGAICGLIEPAEGVERLGRVAHPADLYRQAMVAINPVRVGTGMNIKLLDAMALGLPIVSTETGIRGLGADEADGVRTVPDDDPEGFARAVLDLTSSEDERRRASDAAFLSATRWNERQRGELRAILGARPEERAPTPAERDER